MPLIGHPSLTGPLHHGCTTASARIVRPFIAPPFIAPPCIVRVFAGPLFMVLVFVGLVCIASPAGMSP